MSHATRNAWLVAAREVRERVLSRAFAFSTLAITLIVVAAVVVPALKEKTPRLEIGLSGATPVALPAALRNGAEATQARVSLTRFGSTRAGETALRRGELGVLIVDGRTLVWKSEVDSRTSGVVTAAIRQVTALRRASAFGLSPQQLRALVTTMIPVRHLEAPDAHRESRKTIAMTGFLVLLVVLVWYGSAVAQGVAQEKGDRVMEVLLSRVDPRELLAGKVIGIGVVGFAQLLAAALSGLVTTLTVKSIEVPTAVPAALGSAVLWFVLGYAFWSVAFAAAGALVSRAEDLQATIAPVSWTLLLCAFTGPVAGNVPDAWYSHVASLFPLTAPFAMPARVAVGHVAAWEVALAVMLTAVATYALVNIGARVYAGALLRGGGKPRIRDVWSTLRAT